MPCEISPPAEADLTELGDYIARDNPKRAETFIDELLEDGEKIAQMPTAYAPREDLAPGCAPVRISATSSSSGSSERQRALNASSMRRAT